MCNVFTILHIYMFIYGLRATQCIITVALSNGTSTDLLLLYCQCTTSYL